MHKTHTLLAAAAASSFTLLLAGCAGTSSALLVSSTNVGVDIDSKPPQAEISISRKELAVQPGFEGGKTLPAVMSFSTKGNASFLKKLFFGINTTFSTGRAATTLVGGTPGADDDEGDVIEIDSPPVAHRISDEIRGKHRQLIGPGEMRPLVFGTKTVFGLHAAWDGSNLAPTDLKIGFNRKEAAYAPVGYARNTRAGGKRPYIVQVPSTLATLENGNATGTSGSLEHFHSQYFATGRAAEALAAHPKVRRILLERIEPALTPGTIPVEVGDELVAIDTVHEANPAEIDAASKEATGKTWAQIKRRGTPAQISAVAAECRKRGLL